MKLEKLVNINIKDKIYNDILEKYFLVENPPIMVYQ